MCSQSTEHDILAMRVTITGAQRGSLATSALLPSSVPLPIWLSNLHRSKKLSCIGGGREHVCIFSLDCFWKLTCFFLNGSSYFGLCPVNILKSPSLLSEPLGITVVSTLGYPPESPEVLVTHTAGPKSLWKF